MLKLSNKKREILFLCSLTADFEQVFGENIGLYKTCEEFIQGI